MRNITLILLFFSNSFLVSQNIISKAKTKSDINLRNDASFFSAPNGKKILKNQSVYVFDFKNDYWLISKDSIKGWCKGDFLYKTDTMYVIMNKYKDDINIKKFGLDIGKKINTHQIWIGMTKEMLIASYGNPIDKNITELEDYKSEQWIYKTSYIYLENNIVTAIQNK